jgi:hypothetical protein
MSEGYRLSRELAEEEQPHDDDETLEEARTVHCKSLASGKRADDYITKSFGMDELMAGRCAIGALGCANQRREAVVKTSDSPSTCQPKHVSPPDGEVRLSPTEWHLVELWCAIRERCCRTATFSTGMWMLLGPVALNGRSHRSNERNHRLTRVFVS